MYPGREEIMVFLFEFFQHLSGSIWARDSPTGAEQRKFEQKEEEIEVVFGFLQSLLQCPVLNSRDSGSPGYLQLFWVPLTQSFRLPRWLSGKKNNPPAPARDAGLIPELGRNPGVGNGDPLQHSCLENSMDRGDWQTAVHGVVKSQTLTERWT